jgi:hypothetical protein
MKIKKATKRLEEVEDLLASIIDRATDVDAPRRAILQESKDNVARVKAALLETVDHKAATPPPPATKRAVRKPKKPTTAARRSG